jgi:hypothetical protein
MWVNSQQFLRDVEKTNVMSSGHFCIVDFRPRCPLLRREAERLTSAGHGNAGSNVVCANGQQRAAR